MYFWFCLDFLRKVGSKILWEILFFTEDGILAMIRENFNSGIRGHYLGKWESTEIKTWSISGNCQVCTPGYVTDLAGINTDWVYKNHHIWHNPLNTIVTSVNKIGCLYYYTIRYLERSTTSFTMENSRHRLRQMLELCSSHRYHQKEKTQQTFAFFQ